MLADLKRKDGIGPMTDAEEMMAEAQAERDSELERMRREVNECHDLEENNPVMAAKIRRDARIQRAGSA